MNWVAVILLEYASFPESEETIDFLKSLQALVKGDTDESVIKEKLNAALRKYKGFI